MRRLLRQDFYISGRFRCIIEGDGMADTDKYQCSVCGWIYDPAVGDPDGGIAPGTPFEKIPQNWRCPVCGAEKSAFEKM